MNSIVRKSQFGFVFMLFYNFAQVHLFELPVNSLSEQTLAQMNGIKEASQIYLKDLDWIRRDITEGVLHWSYADFIRDLTVLEQISKDQKPTCFDSMDATMEGLKQVVTEVESCLKKLEDTVREAATLASEAKTVEEADNVVGKLVAYKYTRDKKTEGCKKIAIRMMPIYNAEKKKIEACVKQ